MVGLLVVAAVIIAPAPLATDKLPRLIVPPMLAAKVRVPLLTLMVELPQLTKVKGSARRPLKFRTSLEAVSVTVTPVNPESVICTPFWLAVILPPLAEIATGPAEPRLISSVEPDGTAKFSAMTVAIPWALPSVAVTVKEPGVEPSVALPVPAIEFPLPVIPQPKLGELMALPN